MKRPISIICSVVLVCSILCSCANDGKDVKDNVTTDDSSVVADNNESSESESTFESSTDNVTTEDENTTEEQTTTAEEETTRHTSSEQTTTKKQEILTTSKKQETTTKEEENTTKGQDSSTTNNEYVSYKISSIGYDAVYTNLDSHDIVKNNDKIGVVDFDGNVKIELKYDDYNIVSENEVEFISGNKSYVYNKNFNKIYEYLNKESVDVYGIQYEYRGTTYQLYLFNNHYRGCDEDWCGCDTDEDKMGTIERMYRNGMLIEQYRYLGDIQVNKYVITNIYNGNEIFNDYGRVYIDCTDDNHEGLFISNDLNDDIVIITEDANGIDTICNININGVSYTTCTETNIPSIVESRAFYNNGWIKQFDFDYYLMFSTESMLLVADSLKLDADEYVYGWYYGRGKWCGYNTNKDDKYTLFDGNKTVVRGCSWLNFSSDKYIIVGFEDRCCYYDYNGKKVAEYKDSSRIENSKSLIYDGIGLYYIDDSLNRISEYIYIFDENEDVVFGNAYIRKNGLSYPIAEDD